MCTVLLCHLSSYNLSAGFFNTFWGSLGGSLGFYPRQVFGNSLHVRPFSVWEVVGWPPLEMSLKHCLHSSHPGGAELLYARDSSWLTGWPPPAGSSWLHLCCLGCGSKSLLDKARERTEQPLGERACSFFPSLLTRGRCTCAELKSRKLKTWPGGISSAPSVGGWGLGISD